MELHIEIPATAGQVWALVSVPGWFISRLPEAPAVQRDDHRLSIIRDQEHGPFLIRIVKLVGPSNVAFRWEAPGNCSVEPTLVEFCISDHGADTVLLKMRESDLTTKPHGAHEELQTLEENHAGWAEALEAVRRFLKPEPCPLLAGILASPFGAGLPPLPDGQRLRQRGPQTAPGPGGIPCRRCPLRPAWGS